MKSIKEYISDDLIAGKETFESIFDDEDDLLDKTTDQAAIDWLLKNTDLELPLKHNRVKVNNGKVYVDPFINWNTITIKSNPPKWIKFDEKSWEEQPFNIKYSIKSQKDIDNIPGWIERIEAQTVKNTDINTKFIKFIYTKEIENVILHWDKEDNIHVEFAQTQPDENTLMNISSITNNIYIDIRKTKLCDKLKRQIKKYGTIDSYNKNWNLFRTLCENKIKYLQVSPWNFIRIYDNYITYGA